MMTNKRYAMLAELQRMAKGENLFRPSAIERAMICRGSIIASLRAPQNKRSSPAAREGTAAHLVAASVLEGSKKLEEWADRMIDLEDGGVKIHCSEEMIEAVEMYVDEILRRVEPGCILLIEQKLSLELLDPDDPLFKENKGTSDAVVINPARRRITIGDLKYGKGHMVKGDSPQLKDYLLMALLKYANYAPGGWLSAETLIVQPRAVSEGQRIKPVEHDPLALTFDFVGELVATMEGALDADAPLVSGSHCYFCNASATCPALRDVAQNAARDAFAAVPMMTATTPMAPIPKHVFVGTLEQPKPEEGAAAGTTMTLPLPQSLDPAEIATILGRESLWDAWITSVKHYAVQLIEGGTTIPGYKLLRRSGNRRWKDPEPDEAPIADQLQAEFNLDYTKLYAPAKLKSPAQLEKILKGVDKAKLPAFVERPPGAPTLVRADEVPDDRVEVLPLLGPIAS
jgi:hypothetical protein